MGLHSFRYNMPKIAEALNVDNDTFMNAVRQNRRADIIRIWSADNKGKYTSASISVSRKKQNSNEYEKDFQGYVNMVGAAHEKLKKLGEIPKDGLLIQAIDIDAQRRWNENQKKEYISHSIFDFEIFNPNDFKKSASNTSKSSTKVQNPPIEEDTDDEMDLPF